MKHEDAIPVIEHTQRVGDVWFSVIKHNFPDGSPKTDPRWYVVDEDGDVIIPDKSFQTVVSVDGEAYANRGAIWYKIEGGGIAGRYGPTEWPDPLEDVITESAYRYSDRGHMDYMMHELPTTEYRALTSHCLAEGQLEIPGPDSLPGR